MKPSLLIAAASMLAACAEAPFVEATPAELATLTPGSVVAVCHAPNETPARIAASAESACAARGLRAVRTGGERYQCRLLALHRTRFRCE